MKTQQLSESLQQLFFALLLAGLTACGSAAAAPTSTPKIITTLTDIVSTQVASPSATATLLSVSTPTSTASPTQPAPTPTSTSDSNLALIQTALENARNHCADIGRNQLCFASGPVEVEFQPGIKPQPFTQPGDTLDLALVQSLQLGGTNPDKNKWGLAVLRLQADMIASDQNLTVLAMGDVKISNINVVIEDEAPLFTADSAVSDESAEEILPDPLSVEPLQSFNFNSTPNTPNSRLRPNGLLMWTPAGEEIASLVINGAVVTLGSTALVQAQPGNQMIIGLLEGTALVEAGGVTSAVPAGMRVSLPLTADGTATTPPDTSVVVAVDYFESSENETPVVDPRAAAISSAVAQYGVEQPPVVDPRAAAISNAVAQYGVEQPSVVDPRAAAISSAVAQYGVDNPVIKTDIVIETGAIKVRTYNEFLKLTVRKINQKFNRAVNHCVNEDKNRYVYNVLYWYRQAVLDPDIKAAIGPARLAEMQAKAAQCLKFELRFHSVITEGGFGDPYGYLYELQSTVMLEIDDNFFDRKLVGTALLEYSSVAWIGDNDCIFNAVGESPTLDVRNNKNGLLYSLASPKVTLTYDPDIPAENVTMFCPGVDPLSWHTNAWKTYFDKMHASEKLGNSYRTQTQRLEGEIIARWVYNQTTSGPSGQAVIENTTIEIVHRPTP